MFRFCSLVLALAVPLPSAAETLTGTIRVVDADTIELSSPVNIRLIGIDAPEAAQTCRDVGGRTLPCGALATAMARDLYEGRAGRCEVEGRDRNGRPLAVCTVDGRDIGAELVSRGIARIYREGMAYEDRRYAEEQKAAVLTGRGLWAYEMEDPALWRAGQRADRAAARAPAGDCAIKGNISGNGRLYHLPGSRAYGQTRIDEGRGERWFCSEDAARDAGWTRAGG